MQGQDRAGPRNQGAHGRSITSCHLSSSALHELAFLRPGRHAQAQQGRTPQEQRWRVQRSSRAHHVLAPHGQAQLRRPVSSANGGTGRALMPDDHALHHLGPLASSGTVRQQDPLRESACRSCSTDVTAGTHVSRGALAYSYSAEQRA